MAMSNQEKCKRLREKRKASHVRIDLYLPKDVAERVALHAKELHVAVSSVVEQIVAREYKA